MYAFLTVNGWPALPSARIVSIWSPFWAVRTTEPVSSPTTISAARDFSFLFPPSPLPMSMRRDEADDGCVGCCSGGGIEGKVENVVSAEERTRTSPSRSVRRRRFMPGFRSFTFTAIRSGWNEVGRWKR